MKYFLVEPRGFCFGVENALEMVEKVLQNNPDKLIYVYNEIVHNKKIVDNLRKKGIVFTQEESEIPEGSIVIFSAHGVSPLVRTFFENKKIEIVDATCPLVKKVHKEVIRYTKEGYHIIYIGDPEHDEVKGVVAEAPDNITVVQKKEDLCKVKKHNKYVVLNQTTLNMFETQKLLQVIKQVFLKVVFPKKEDICYATTARQQAVKKSVQNCDAFIVIGSKNSSNSKKLKEIATQCCTKSILIDDASEINQEWLRGVEMLCITSGASAPEYLVDELITRLREEFGFELGS
jgi:4-hydroxy-3-methylbut-2-en-1-yl diphosphate reductase